MQWTTKQPIPWIRVLKHGVRRCPSPPLGQNDCRSVTYADLYTVPWFPIFCLTLWDEACIARADDLLTLPSPPSKRKRFILRVWDRRVLASTYQGYVQAFAPIAVEELRCEIIFWSSETAVQWASVGCEPSCLSGSTAVAPSCRWRSQYNTGVARRPLIAGLPQPQFAPRVLAYSRTVSKQFTQLAIR